MTSSLKSFNKSQEFLIISFISSFYQNLLFAEKDHRVLLTIFRLREILCILRSYIIGKVLILIILVEYFINSKVRNISLILDMMFKVKMVKIGILVKDFCKRIKAIWALKVRKSVSRFIFYIVKSGFWNLADFLIFLAFIKPAPPIS